jgi:hypothetical protein
VWRYRIEHLVIPEAVFMVAREGAVYEHDGCHLLSRLLRCGDVKRIVTYASHAAVDDAADKDVAVVEYAVKDARSTRSRAMYSAMAARSA